MCKHYSKQMLDVIKPSRTCHYIPPQVSSIQTICKSVNRECRVLSFRNMRQVHVQSYLIYPYHFPYHSQALSKALYPESSLLHPFNQPTWQYTYFRLRKIRPVFNHSTLEIRLAHFSGQQLFLARSTHQISFVIRESNVSHSFTSTSTMRPRLAVLTIFSLQ